MDQSGDCAKFAFSFLLLWAAPGVRSVDGFAPSLRPAGEGRGRSAVKVLFDNNPSRAIPKFPLLTGVGEQKFSL